MWPLTKYLLTFAAGQVAGIISAHHKDRSEFIVSARATIHRLTEPK